MAVKLHTDGSGYEFVWHGNPYEEGFQEFPHHRLIAVAEVGFEAVTGRVVHHENGVPWDNRPGNLRVMSKSEHNSLHKRGEGNPGAKLTNSFSLLSNIDTGGRGTRGQNSPPTDPRREDR